MYKIQRLIWWPTFSTTEEHKPQSWGSPFLLPHHYRSPCLNGWSGWPSQLQASSNAGTMSITVSLWWTVPKLVSHSCDKTTHDSNPRELPVISEIYWTVLCRVLYPRSTNPFIWENTPTLDIRALIYTTKVWNLLYFTCLLHSISSTLFFQ